MHALWDNKGHCRRRGVISIDPEDGGKPIDITILTDPDQLTRMWAQEALPPLTLPDEYAKLSGTRKRGLYSDMPDEKPRSDLFR